MHKSYEGPIKLKTVEIDVEKNVYKINGMDYKNIARNMTIVITPRKIKVYVDGKIPTDFVSEKTYLS